MLPRLVSIQKQHFNQLAIDLHIAPCLLMLANLPENKEGDEVNGNDIVAIPVL